MGKLRHREERSTQNLRLTTKLHWCLLNPCAVLYFLFLFSCLKQFLFIRLSSKGKGIFWAWSKMDNVPYNEAVFTRNTLIFSAVVHQTIVSLSVQFGFVLHGRRIGDFRPGKLCWVGGKKEKRERELIHSWYGSVLSHHHYLTAVTFSPWKKIVWVLTPEGMNRNVVWFFFLILF